MAQDTSKATDSFSRSSNTMRDKTYALNKDLDEVIEKMNHIKKTKVTIAIDTTKAMAKMQQLITMRAELNSMNKTKLTVNVDTKNTMNELKAMEKKLKDYNKAIADIERSVKSLNDKLKETASLSQSAEDSASKSNNKTGNGLGDSLKDAVVEKGVDLVLDTVSNASSTFLSSAFGSKGEAYSNVLSMGINGAEIGFGMAGPVGAVLGGVIGAGLELINGTLKNYAEEDEKYKSYVQDQYGKIIQNRSDELDSSLKLAAGQEDASDPNSFTAKTKALEDAKNQQALKMGNAYKLERTNGKGGLSDQLDFNKTNGAKLEELNGRIAEYEADIQNKKDQYRMDAQNILLHGVPRDSNGSEDTKEVKRLKKAFTEDGYNSLLQSHNEYTNASGRYNKAPEVDKDGNVNEDRMRAAADMQVGFESANALAENAYGGSGTAQIEQKANEALVTNLKESAAKSDLGWKAVSHIEAMLSEGRLSVAPAVKNPSPAAYRFGYDPRTISKSESGKGSAYGLSYVPYNNFPVLLHEGERVLTASENRGYKSGAGVTVTGNSFTVREEADINKVAKALYREIEKARMVMAV